MQKWGFYLRKLPIFVIFFNVILLSQGRILLKFRACSSVVERCPDKTEVDGPIPSMLTDFEQTKCSEKAVTLRKRKLPKGNRKV